MEWKGPEKVLGWVSVAKRCLSCELCFFFSQLYFPFVASLFGLLAPHSDSKAVSSSRLMSCQLRALGLLSPNDSSKSSMAKFHWVDLGHVLIPEPITMTR